VIPFNFAKASLPRDSAALRHFVSQRAMTLLIASLFACGSAQHTVKRHLRGWHGACMGSIDLTLMNDSGRFFISCEL